MSLNGIDLTLSFRVFLLKDSQIHGELRYCNQVVIANSTFLLA